MNREGNIQQVDHSPAKLILPPTSPADKKSEVMGRKRVIFCPELVKDLLFNKELKMWIFHVLFDQL